MTIIDKLFNKLNKKCQSQTRITSFLLEDFQNDEEIIVPEGIRVIASEAFAGFSNLKKVVLPSSLERIEESAFSGCENLVEINLPSSVHYLGHSVFEGCNSLKKISIPNKIRVIPVNAFCDCSSLEEVSLGENVKIISDYAFVNCASLRKINLDKYVRHIGSYSFRNCHSLGKIYLNSKIELGDFVFDNCSNAQVINDISKQLLSYINSVSKKRYEILEELYQINSNFREIINYVSLQNTRFRDENIDKFKQLFYKMRVKDMVSLDIFLSLNLEQAKNFDYKLWKEIEKYVFFEESETAIAFINFMNIFGLFKNDQDKEKRKSLFIKLISNKYKKCYVPSDRIPVLEQFQENFEKIMKKEYVLEKSPSIPREFAVYLDELMSEEKVRKLKRINGTYGLNLNKFIKNNYKVYEEPYYALKEKINAQARQEISKLLFLNNLDEYGFNQENISILFRELDDVSYDKEFYNFLINNLDTILFEVSESWELDEIRDLFSEIKEFYRNLGKEKIDIYDCYRYMDIEYKKASFGDEKFIKYLHDSGAKQGSYDFYSELYKKIKKKYKTTLPDTDITFDYYGDKIRIRRLSCNDPMQLFVGERNYTNCCQVHNDVAENCIEAIADFSNIGITVVELIENGRSILLAQSFDWTNNSMYCHDNIEGTDFLRDNYDVYQEVVLEAYRRQAQEIIEKSSAKTNEYLNKKERELSVTRLKKLKEQLENQKIKVVTVGENHSAINIANLKDVDHLVNCIDVGIDCYSDSKYKKLLCGDETKIDISKLSDIKQIELFKETRNVCEIFKRDITGEEILKMSLIENENKKTTHTTFDYDEMKDFDITNYYHFCDKIEKDIHNSRVIIGEDWYLIYSVTDNEVKIHDLKNGKLRDKEEKLRQALEIKNALARVMEESLIFDEVDNLITRKPITVLANKNNTYRLYVSGLEKGLINEENEKQINGVEELSEVSFTLSDKYVRKILQRK